MEGMVYCISQFQRFQGTEGVAKEGHSPLSGKQRARRVPGIRDPMTSSSHKP